MLGDDGLLDPLLGDGGVVDAVIGDDGLVGGVLGDDSILDPLLGEDGVVDAVVGDEGLLGGVLGDGDLLDPLLDEGGVLGGSLGGGILSGLLGGKSDDAEAEVPVIDVEVEAEADSGAVDIADETLATVTDELGDAVAEVLGADEPGDAEPDGVLESLLSSPADTVLEGLLGGDDPFGIDVEPVGDGLVDGVDDLTAGLGGHDGLTGTLVDRGIVESVSEDALSETDQEVNSLLNEILGAGTGDILGGASAFEALLGDDGSSLGGGIFAESEVETDSAVESALDTLFGSVVDEGSSLLGLMDKPDTDEGGA